MPEKPEPQLTDSGDRVYRVLDKGANVETTLSVEFAEWLGDKVELLDKPAVDRRGAPLPAKPRRPLAGVVEEPKGRAPKSKEESQ